MKSKRNGIVLSILIVIIITSIVISFIMNKDNGLIINYKWQKEDNSVMYLYRNKTFKLYNDDSMHEDNYYFGKYEIYNGDDAVEYIANSLSSYEVTKVKQEELIMSGYKKENYYAIVVKNEYYMENGTKTSLNTRVPYYGFYNDRKNELELVNMDKSIVEVYKKLGKID